ncbi:MAG: exodeoxyribonuclease VII small subunit [Jaaginema sp. PMC 1079.18]|nr:exodeoxyribonuclease VII small subunit [Jaaginema sp. PMC 1080.18]MEC4853150.1 exodeoxyribonuclease VII small subunit [Jaaginema sp. PMC 1079.18]MEC4864662.1 exodeoxyribonuclease VII small subunit [Jaaginema sp. PMC 1078.18]
MSSWQYESEVSAIEDIIEQIESGDLPLEAVFEEFAIAVAKLQACEQFLKQGQDRLTLLVETLEDRPDPEF